MGNYRRFTIRITMVSGRYYDVIRECDRKPAATKEWVINDFASFFEHDNIPRLNYETVEGKFVSLVKSNVESFELIHTVENLDLEAVKNKFGLTK